MKELSTKDLKKAQRKVSEESIRLTKALGLPYYTVKKGFLYLIDPDGKEKKIRKAVFGTRKINQKQFKIGHENETL